MKTADSSLHFNQNHDAGSSQAARMPTTQAGRSRNGEQPSSFPKFSPKLSALRVVNSHVFQEQLATQLESQRVANSRSSKAGLKLSGAAFVSTGLVAVGGAAYLWYGPHQQAGIDSKIPIGVGSGGLGLITTGLGLLWAGMRKSE